MVKDILAEPVGPGKAEATRGGLQATEARFAPGRPSGGGHKDGPQADGAASKSPWQKAARGRKWGQDGERPMPVGRGRGLPDHARLPGGHASARLLSPDFLHPLPQRPHGLCCDLGLGLQAGPDSGAGRRGWPAAHLWMRLVLPT